MEKGWRKRHDAAKDAIMSAHRRGSCDTDGNSIKRGGVFVAKPKYLGKSVVQTMCNRCHQWYGKAEGHECPEIKDTRMSKYSFSWFF